MTIEEMIKRKEDLGLTYEQISRSAGIPVGTVQKVLGRITKSPRYDTLRALESVLSADANGGFLMEDGPKFDGSNKRNTISRRNAKKPGEFTIEDYYVLPDEKRVELIDGVFYDMSSPSTAHQIIALNIYAQINNFIKSQKGKCIPFAAPCDVQLDKDDKTMIQPDVMIICDRNKIVKQKIFGAPDFVVEVLSDSTKKKDMTTKLSKYVNAGVKEYWIVDPDKQKIIVYDFANDYEVTIYGFKDKIPVGIYHGKCLIDFNTILEEIEFLI